MNRRATLAATGGGARSSTGTAAVFVALAVVCLVVVLAIRARPNPDPYDPSSGRPDGTRALVQLLDRFGGGVRTGETVPSSDSGQRLLVLIDRLDLEQRAAVEDYVRRGGVLVVADPDSTLGVGGELSVSRGISGSQRLPTVRRDVEIETNLPRGECSVSATQDVRGLFVPSGSLFDRSELPVTGDDQVAGTEVPACFADESSTFLAVFAVGDGVVVRLGDIDIWTNEHLRRADNAVLATALLAPAADSDVSIVLGTGTDRSIEAIGTGDDRLRDLVPAWVWVALLGGLGAFVVFAASRSIRPVKVPSEPVAVPIAASEFVEATGVVMERAEHHQRSAEVLRSRFRRDLVEALDAPLNVTDDELARRANQLGLDTAQVQTLLMAQLPTGADGIAAYAAQISQARRTALAATN